MLYSKWQNAKIIIFLFHVTLTLYKAPTKCGCFLCGKKRGCDMAEPKTIYCPMCKRKVTQWDGKSTINPLGECTKCKKLVIYRIDSNVTEIIIKPERKQSSGLTFY